MESQLTLVNTLPPNASQPADTLYLSPDDVKHTIIKRQSTNQGLYQVKTNKTATETVIFRANGSPLAVWRRKDLIPDTISFDGGPEIRIKKWLKFGGLTSIKLPVNAAIEMGGKKYVWKSSGRDVLALYAASDTSVPIAWGRRSVDRTDGAGLAGFAFQTSLDLQPEALEQLDSVIVSFLILEWEIRMARNVLSAPNAYSRSALNTGIPVTGAFGPK